MPSLRLYFAREQMQNYAVLDFIHTLLLNRVDAEVYMCPDNRLEDPVRVHSVTHSDKFTINREHIVDILDPESELSSDSESEHECCPGYDVLADINPNTLPPSEPTFEHFNDPRVRELAFRAYMQEKVSKMTKP